MKVFVSYARSDRTYLDQLSDALVNSGVTCLSDKGIPLGKPWYRYADAYIKECHAVVVVVSRNTLAYRADESECESPQLGEIEVSLDSGKRVIAILLHLDESELPGWLKILLRTGQRLRSVSGAADARAVVEALAGTEQHGGGPVRKPRWRREWVYLGVGFAIGITVLLADAIWLRRPTLVPNETPSPSPVAVIARHQDQRSLSSTSASTDPNTTKTTGTPNDFPAIGFPRE